MGASPSQSVFSFSSPPTPLAFGAVLDATNAAGTTPTAWGWAFATLGVGGGVAAACAWGLERDRVRATIA